MQAEQQEREVQLSELTKKIRAILQEKRGLEVRSKNLNQELSTQHRHLEELRGHKVVPILRFQSLWRHYPNAPSFLARLGVLQGRCDPFLDSLGKKLMSGNAPKIAYGLLSAQTYLLSSLQEIQQYLQKQTLQQLADLVSKASGHKVSYEEAQEWTVGSYMTVHYQVP